MAGGGPPHWHGKLFKMKCDTAEGRRVMFSGIDDGKPVEVELWAEDATYFKPGQEYTIDFRPVPEGR